MSVLRFPALMVLKQRRDMIMQPMTGLFMLHESSGFMQLEGPQTETEIF